VEDIKKAREAGKASFPGFDHAEKDPVEGKYEFDSKKHEVVLVEGLYILLEKEPWSKLQDIFASTYFIDIKEGLTAQRLIHRMTTEMGLTMEEA